MLRLPAVAGRFYPSDPAELTALVHKYAKADPQTKPVQTKACLVPHAGYIYSGHVAGAVFARTALPKRILVLGVRHYPRGESAAILLREDSVAHSAEHSLEVQLPFLQVLVPGFTFVPVALGTVRFEDLVTVGEAIARILEAVKEDVLLLTTSDLNHYEDDATTRVKDHKAIAQLLARNPRGLFDTCRNENISMCGLGPAVAMLTALNALGAKNSDLVKYATSADVSGDRDAVVGYAGMIFS